MQRHTESAKAIHIILKRPWRNLDKEPFIIPRMPLDSNHRSQQRLGQRQRKRRLQILKAVPYTLKRTIRRVIRVLLQHNLRIAWSLKRWVVRTYLRKQEGFLRTHTWRDLDRQLSGLIIESLPLTITTNFQDALTLPLTIETRSRGMHRHRTHLNHLCYRTLTIALTTRFP